MHSIIFLVVYFYASKKKGSLQPSGMGHWRRCAELQKILLSSAECVGASQKKISVALESFSCKQNLFNLVKNISPDVVVLDVREGVDKATLLSLQKQGIFTVVLDSNDQKMLEVADYHVQSLPCVGKMGKRIFGRFFKNSQKYLENDYTQKDIFPQKSSKYSSTLANLYGWEYLCMREWKKVIPASQKNRKIVIYVGSFFENERVLEHYQKQWKKVFSQAFWGEFSSPIECVIIIDSQDPQHHASMHDFFLRSINQNHDSNDFLPVAVCDCINILTEEKMMKLVGDCHLFLTHFGVSFLQALSKDIAVSLLLPTHYHASISRWYFAPFVTETLRDYETLVRDTQSYIQKKYIGVSQEKLGRILVEMANDWVAKRKTAKNRNICYYCKSQKVRNLYRFPTFSWQYCDDCASAVQRRYGLEKIFPENFPNYNSDYFEKEYRENYGITYEEDEKKIKEMSESRLENIESLLKSSPKKRWILDIGAAYGFFLDVMKEKGSFATAGIEISSHAFAATKKHHRLFQGDAQKLDFHEILHACGVEHFDVVSMWYVIEHFPCLYDLLRKISDCQKKGGIFVFSTPNFLGISARKSKKNFIAGSPLDHFHLLTSRGMAALLKDYGYTLQKVVSTGIHQSRYEKYFPILSKVIPFAFYQFFARKKNWGDTMELYFLKI